MSTNPEGYQKEYYRARRRSLLNFFGARCVRCGEVDTTKLEFHHVNGYEGKRCRSRGRGGQQQLADISSIIAEGRKDEIEVLCISCHNVIHMEKEDGL